MKSYQTITRFFLLSLLILAMSACATHSSNHQGPRHGSYYREPHYNYYYGRPSKTVHIHTSQVVEKQNPVKPDINHPNPGRPHAGKKPDDKRLGYNHDKKTGGNPGKKPDGKPGGQVVDKNRPKPGHTGGGSSLNRADNRPSPRVEPRGTGNAGGRKPSAEPAVRKSQQTGRANPSNSVKASGPSVRPASKATSNSVSKSSAPAARPTSKASGNNAAGDNNQKFRRAI